MVLLKRIFFMKFYFVFVFLFSVAHGKHAERRYSNSSIKTMIVQEIMKKVSNITLNALSKTPADKKELILNKIENKLKKSAKSMGSNADKYVKFIMDEFKNKAFAKENQNVSVTDVLRKSISLRSEQKVTPRGVIDPETRQEIIKDIATKIQNLAKGFIKNAKTVESRKRILENIKKRIMDSAKQKHMQLHNKHEELKAYSSLIAEGLEVSMRKMLADDSDARRMDDSEVEIQPALIKHKTGDDRNMKNDTDVPHDLLKKTMIVLDIQEINRYKELISKSLNDTSIDPRCDEVVEDTCTSIQSFNKIPCGEGKSVPIENLCNGVIDCVNQVDEMNCSAQAMEKVRKATQVMSEIEASLARKCFVSDTDGQLLTAQNQILRDVLKTQMDFLEKHLKTPLMQQTANPEEDEIYIKKTVTDVNMILSTLSYALDGTLCAHRVNPDNLGNRAARKFNDVDVDLLEEVTENPAWSPKSCLCKGQFCKDSTCEAPCKRVCWQRYSLNHWGCSAINGGTSVSLNVVCDGKLDCFDETDESNCASGSNFSKFLASKSYSTLLDLLTTKSKSFEFVKSRNKLISIHGLVTQLQKQTIKTNIDNHVIKTLRDEAFEMLVSIYDDLLQTCGLEELDDRYLILLSINEKIVTALKRSHFGNDNLISPEGCYCRGGLCALRRCNKNCIQACLAEPVLTRFDCNLNNATVPIESICNGRKNCLNGEDEKDCVKDVCRAHHLVVLRHNLQNYVSARNKGSVLGEVLESWKTKVSAILIIAETAERPNHKIMIDIMSRILHDLVVAFAAMEDYRRTHSDSALQQFIGLSKIVMNTLKSCSY